MAFQLQSEPLQVPPCWNCFNVIPTHFADMTAVITGKDIDVYRGKVLLSALKLELLGMKRSRGRTAYSIIKSEFHLKGGRQSVYDQFKLIVG
jgi:hypothetical protein